MINTSKDDASSKAIDASNAPSRSLRGLMKQLWQICIQVLSPNYEPKVWQRVDRQGRITSLQVLTRKAIARSALGLRWNSGSGWRSGIIARWKAEGRRRRGDAGTRGRGEREGRRQRAGASSQ